MDRSIFTGGPAYLTWNGTTFQMHEDWKVDMMLGHFDIGTNLQGKRVEQGIADTMAKITCKPIAFGGSIATLFTKLFPYSPASIGKLTHPGTDLPAVIQTKFGGTSNLGQSITFSAVAITKMPDIIFAPDKVFFGDVELTCLVANNAAPSDANALYTVADSTYAEPSLNPLDILFDLYKLTYGISPSAPFDGVETDENGIVFSPTLTTKPRKTARLGTYNFMIEDVQAVVKFTPENVTAANWASLLTAQGAGYGRGALRSSFGDRLVIAGSASGKAQLTIPLAAATDGNLRFGTDSLVEGVAMSAARKYSSILSSATVNTSVTVTIPTGTAVLAVGMGVTGTGIAGGTTIATIATATTITLSAAATASGTVNLTYTGLHPLFALGTVP